MCTRKCFLCNASNYEQTLFKFPDNGWRRTEWFEFCGLSESIDNVTNVRICSLHFDSSFLTKGRRLRGDAVPSLLVSNKNKKSKKDSQSSAYAQASNNVYSVKEEKNEEVNSPMNNIVYIKSEFDENINNALTNSTKNINNYQIVVIPRTTNILNTVKEELVEEVKKIPPYATTEKIDISEIELLDKATEIQPYVAERTDSVEATKPAPSRKCKDPRFVQEIVITDMETPQQAKRVLYLVKNTDKKKSKKISALQGVNRRLKKRISILEQLLKEKEQK